MRCHRILGMIRAIELKDKRLHLKVGFLQAEEPILQRMNPSALQCYSYCTAPTVLPTSTAHRYLVPTVLWASRRCISAIAVVVAVAIIIGGGGAVAATGLGVACPTAA